MSEKPLTSCCQKPYYSDPINYVTHQPMTKRRIGFVSRCSGCHAIKGDCKLDRPYEDKALLAIQKKFTGTSWAMALDVVAKKKGGPINFVDGTAGVLQPENYAGELKHHADLPKEPDF